MGSGGNPTPSFMPHAGGGGALVLAAGAHTGSPALVIAAIVFLAVWTTAMAVLATRSILPKRES